MATVSTVSKPGYIYDANTDTWYPIGVGSHTHSDAIPASANVFAGKNKIINGDFGVWQRGVGPFTANGAFGPDRFINSFTGTGAALSNSQQTFTPGAAPVAGYESTFFSRYAVTAGSDAVNSYVFVTHKIEDVRQCAAQTVTVSFYAKATSGTPGISFDIYQDFGTGGSATPTSTGQKVAISTSWARYSLTFSLASISGKTIGTGSNLAIRMWFSAGSAFNSTTGTLGTQSNTFDIWGVQVEQGSTATPFQTASGTIAGELALCQRYYVRNGGVSVYQELGFLSGTSATGANGQVPVPTTMRVAPTSIDFSTLSLTEYSGNVAVTNLTLTGTAGGGNVIPVTATVASGLTQYRMYAIRTNNSTSGYIGFSAEL